MKKLPVGIDEFRKLREKDYYYTDKTLLVKELMKREYEVTLFTRPRRFGKTLNMTMLKSFFEIGTDPQLFEGLAIAADKEFCDKNLGKYPVIFLSLKNVEGKTFEMAMSSFKGCISALAEQFELILYDNDFSQISRDKLNMMIHNDWSRIDFTRCLVELSSILMKYYKHRVIILIDEYDVPLEKAYDAGYYNDMIAVIREIFNNALKTNSCLEFAVLTGCLRIAKESIFTGLNNFDVRTISDTDYDEYFGLTDLEVKKMLQDYGLAAYHEEAKNWYDGYLFGRKYVYCPWSVINYIGSKLSDKNSVPGDYWINSSHNGILDQFFTNYGADIKEDIDALLNNKCVYETVNENLTYDTVYTSKNNIWSMLYAAGYLTKASLDLEAGLRIPNNEIMHTFKNKVSEWFSKQYSSNKRKIFWDALWSKNTETLTALITADVFDTISFFDYSENFYHAILVGMLLNAEYKIDSNKENGIGRSDISVKDQRNKRAIIIEVKVAKTEKGLNRKCDEALKQIKDKMYSKTIKIGNHYDVIEYGIAFFQKSCLVKAASDDDKMKEMNLF